MKWRETGSLHRDSRNQEILTLSISENKVVPTLQANNEIARQILCQPVNGGEMLGLFLVFAQRPVIIVAPALTHRGLTYDQCLGIDHGRCKARSMRSSNAAELEQVWRFWHLLFLSLNATAAEFLPK